MLTRSQVDRQFAERALKAEVLKGETLVPLSPETADRSWLAARCFDPDINPGDTRSMLRRDVSRGPTERPGTGPVPGMSPAEILYDLLERQVASVITAAMPGPQAWEAYELPLPGTPQAQRDRAVKGDPVTPQHSACEGAVNGQDGEEAEDAEGLRLRIQHEADPYPVDAPEVAHADLGKRYDGAYEPPPSCPRPQPVSPADFQRPVLIADHPVRSPGHEPPRPAREVPPVSPAAFRHPPATAGHAAYSTGYEPPFPSWVPGPGTGMVSRPLMTDGCPEVGMSALRGPA